MQKRSVFAALAAVAVTATAVYAAVTFDPETGEGFVGKGEVQTVFDWNNKALQTGALNVEFRAMTAAVTEWTCTKEHPSSDPAKDIVQVRQNSTSYQGVLSSVARENSKGKDGPITGFHLLGYDGDPIVETDGDPVGSCPADQSGFVYDENAETNILGGGLQVSINGSSWFDIE